MRLQFYTNENTKKSVLYYQKEEGAEIGTSEPKSLEEYEVYRALHLSINGEGGEEQMLILMEQMEEE